MRGLVIATALAAGLLAADCASLAEVVAFEKGVAEHAVEKTYDELGRRLCRLPLDVHARTIERCGGDHLRALVLLCPTWRAIRDRITADIAARPRDAAVYKCTTR